MRIDTNKKRRPERLGDILQTWVRAHPFPRRSRAEALGTAWREIAGEATARHSRVTAYREGSVEVTVDSAALLQELSSFRKTELLAALSVRMTSITVRDLRFRQA